MSTTSERGTRSRAEWATFAGSCLVLAIVVALIAVQLLNSDDPAAPKAVATGEVRQVNGQHQVTVEVRNLGDRTAANVQVNAELQIDDRTNSGDQVIDFLPGGATHDLVFVFDDPPSAGKLTVSVTGYAIP